MRDCAWALVDPEDTDTAGLDVTITDAEGNNPLHLWPRVINHYNEENASILVQLLSRGADVNALNNAGMTPLQLICKLDSYPKPTLALAMNLLIDRGAHLDFCVYRVIEGFLESLQNFNLWPEQLLGVDSATKDATLLVERLVSAGANANVPAHANNTTLQMLLQGRVREVMNLFPDCFRPLIVAVVKAGAFSNWDLIPTPYPGIEAAMEAVWTKKPEDLDRLFGKMTEEHQQRVRAGLKCLHRLIGRAAGAHALVMKIIGMVCE